MGVAVTTVGVVALLAQPAAAVGGFARSSRGVKLDVDGARTQVSVKAKMVNSAPLSGMRVRFGLGSASNPPAAQVGFVQNGDTRASRLLNFEMFSDDLTDVDFKGNSCFYEFRLACELNGYDWQTGRNYRVSVTRVSKNDTGSLWLVQVRNMTAEVTKDIIAFRIPLGKLSIGPGNNLDVYSNIADCELYPTVQAEMTKPVTPNSPVTWGAMEASSGCAGAILEAEKLTDPARVRLAIRQPS